MQQWEGLEKGSSGREGCWQWEDESAQRSRKSGAAHGYKLRCGPCMLALRVWDEGEGSRQVWVHPLGSQRSDKAMGILVFPGATHKCGKFLVVLKRLLLGGKGWLAEIAPKHRGVRCVEDNTVRYKP